MHKTDLLAQVSGSFNAISFYGHALGHALGGEAIQHVLLARAWRDLGHDVSIIVHDEGQGAKRVVDGITAIAAHTRKGGIPGLRFFHPRASKLVSALSTGCQAR